MPGKFLENPAEIFELANKAVYAVLSMSDDGIPYAVPINAVWSDGCFYMHSRHAGRKIDVLRKNPRVSLTFVPEAAFVMHHERNACGASMAFESVCASGVAELLGEDADPEERRAAMMALVRHYNIAHLPLNDAVLAKTTLIRVRCDSAVGIRKAAISS